MPPVRHKFLPLRHNGLQKMHQCNWTQASGSCSWREEGRRKDPEVSYPSLLCFIYCVSLRLGFGFGCSLDLVKVWIWLRFGIGWGLDLVDVRIWLRFEFGWGMELVEVWIWLRFGFGWGLDLLRFGFVEVLSWVELSGLVWFGLAWGDGHDVTCEYSA